MPPIRSDLKVSVSASGKSENCKKPLSPLPKTQQKPIEVIPLVPTNVSVVSTPEIKHAVDHQMVSQPCAIDHVAHPKEFRSKECSACSEIFTPNNGRQLSCHNCSPNLKQPAKRSHVDPTTENEHKRCVIEKEVVVDNNNYIETIKVLSTSVARLSAAVHDQQIIIHNMSKELEEFRKKRALDNQQGPSLSPRSQPATFLEAAARDVQPRRVVPLQSNIIRNAPAVHQLHLKIDSQIPAKKLSFKEISELQNKIEKTLPSEKKNFVVSKIRAGNKGGMVLNFETKSDCDKAMKTFNEQSTVLGLQASEIKVKPRLLVKNIPTTFSKEEILAAAIQRNDKLSNLLEEDVSGLKVVTLLKNHNRPDIQSVVFEATPKVHSFFLNEKKITIGMCRYDITEHVHSLQCSRCMKYGHHFSECKATAPNCGVCAKKHQTQSCPHFNSVERPRNVTERRCVNCDNSPLHCNAAQTHAAIDKKICPVSQAYELSRRQLIAHVC
jgi:hypothetical protein